MQIRPSDVDLTSSQPLGKQHGGLEQSDESGLCPGNEEIRSLWHQPDEFGEGKALEHEEEPSFHRAASHSFFHEVEESRASPFCSKHLGCRHLSHGYQPD